MSKLFDSPELEKGGLNVFCQPGSLPAIIEVNGEVIEVYVEKLTTFFVKLRIKADPNKVEIVSPKTLFTLMDPKNCSTESWGETYRRDE